MGPPPQCSRLYIGDLVCIVIFFIWVNTVSLSRSWACHTAWRGHNTQSMVKLHQKSVKEKTTKAARHRGTQKRRSSRLYQSVQDRAQRKACRDRQNRYQTQTMTNYTKFSCVFAHRGAHEVSCPVVHRPAAAWRSMLRDLPLGDKAGRVRRHGSVVMVN